MANDVDKALSEIVSDKGQMELTKAQEYLKRYIFEIASLIYWVKFIQYCELKLWKVFLLSCSLYDFISCSYLHKNLF